MDSERLFSDTLAGHFWGEAVLTGQTAASVQILHAVFPIAISKRLSRESIGSSGNQFYKLIFKRARGYPRSQTPRFYNSLAPNVKLSSLLSLIEE